MYHSERVLFDCVTNGSLLIGYTNQLKHVVIALVQRTTPKIAIFSPFVESVIAFIITLKT